MFRREIFRWHALNSRTSYDTKFIKQLHSTACEVAQAQITFDERFADAILFCANLHLALALGQEEQNRKDLDIYVKMAAQLY